MVELRLRQWDDIDTVDPHVLSPLPLSESGRDVSVRGAFVGVRC